MRGAPRQRAPRAAAELGPVTSRLGPSCGPGSVSGLTAMLLSRCAWGCLLAHVGDESTDVGQAAWLGSSWQPWGFLVFVLEFVGAQVEEYRCAGWNVLVCSVKKEKRKPAVIFEAPVTRDVAHGSSIFVVSFGLFLGGLSYVIRACCRCALMFSLVWSFQIRFLFSYSCQNVQQNFRKHIDWGETAIQSEHQ